MKPCRIGATAYYIGVARSEEMEQPRHANSRAAGFRYSLLTILVVALSIAGTVRPAGAQTGNTSFGTGALGKDTTGNNNSAFGFDPLFENTTGSDNTAVGANALGANIGFFNTATGSNALFANSSGSFNTATGFDALFSNQGGSDNSAIGYQALFSNTTGQDNTGTGLFALRGNTTGSFNTATGEGALDANTTGDDNTLAAGRGLPEISCSESLYNFLTRLHGLLTVQEVARQFEFNSLRHIVLTGCPGAIGAPGGRRKDTLEFKKINQWERIAAADYRFTIE